jgi:hypothetical protein
MRRILKPRWLGAITGVELDSLAAGLIQMSAGLGQSKNIGRRLHQHLCSGKSSKEEIEKANRVEVQGDKAAHEMVEQRRMNAINRTEPGRLLNKQRAVSKARFERRERERERERELLMEDRRILSADKAGRWVVEDPYEEGPTFVATSEWTPATSRALVESDVHNLVLNTALGYQAQSLEFIDSEWSIRRLGLVDWRERDLSPLSRLGSLEVLSVDVADTAKLDLGWFSELKELGADWRYVRDSIDDAPSTLREVTLSGYSGVDLGVLATLTGLEALSLTQARFLESLDGVGWPSLRRIDLAYAPRLADLRALEGSSFRALETLEFEVCNRVHDLRPVSALSKLRRIGVNDCKQVDSIAPLRDLRRLEVVELWGSTVIADSDLSVLLELPRLREVRVADRRSYDPRRAVIEEHVAANTASD